MSLGVSLSAALSGLSASAKAASVVSSNVANAMTENYGVRSLELASQTVGASGSGVRVVAVNRQEDLVLLNDRRLAQSDQGEAETLARFARTAEASIGNPENPGSLHAMITGFEQALVEASAGPESEVRLNAVVNAATGLTGKINDIAEDIGSARQQADQEIGRTVAMLNTALEQISELNSRIRRGGSASRDIGTLIDARQQLVDQVAQEIPIRQLSRDRGEIAIVGMGGVMLLDGSARTLGFEPRNSIVPSMSVENGALSTLTVGGNPVDIQSAQRPLRGGRLEALFSVRDVEAPQAQARIDAVARDILERFQDPNVDTSLMPGDAGLFTDGGIAFDASNELALANRLEVNISVDPAQGGALWRLRDGIGAAVSGPTGNTAQLDRFVSAMADGRLAASGDFSAVARSASGFASDFLSIMSSERANIEIKETFSANQVAALRAEELTRGVDTDSEMQRLLLIEQSYAANAKVIEVVSDLLERLERAVG